MCLQVSAQLDRAAAAADAAVAELAQCVGPHDTRAGQWQRELRTQQATLRRGTHELAGLVEEQDRCVWLEGTHLARFTAIKKLRIVILGFGTS